MKGETKKNDNIIIHLIGGKRINVKDNYEHFEVYMTMKILKQDLLISLNNKYLVPIDKIIYIEKKDLK